MGCEVGNLLDPESLAVLELSRHLLCFLVDPAMKSAAAVTRDETAVLLVEETHL